MTCLIHNTGQCSIPVKITYHGHGGKKIAGADPYHLQESSAGRWVGVGLPNLSLLRSHAPRTGRSGASENAGAAPNPGYLQWVLDQFSIPLDPNPGKELTQRIRERARELPIPDACLVKRLESMYDFMPEDPGATRLPDHDGGLGLPRAPEGPALAPLPLYSWEDDLAGQLALITQSSRHVWLRSKMPILGRIHPDSAHLAILLPQGFSDPHIREIPPRRLREVARE